MRCVCAGELGGLYALCGRYTEAVSVGRSAAEDCEALGDWYNALVSLTRRGLYYNESGQYDSGFAAMAMAGIACRKASSLSPLERGNMRRGILNSLGSLYTGIGNFSDALTCCEEGYSSAVL